MSLTRLYLSKRQRRYQQSFVNLKWRADGLAGENILVVFHLEILMGRERNKIRKNVRGVGKLEESLTCRLSLSLRIVAAEQ